MNFLNKVQKKHKNWLKNIQKQPKFNKNSHKKGKKEQRTG